MSERIGDNTFSDERQLKDEVMESMYKRLPESLETGAVAAPYASGEPS